MSKSVIRVDRLSKRFQLAGRGGYGTLREALVRSFKSLLRAGRSAADSDEAKTVWALRDVSFELNQGDVLGVIGANGAGKSTLLKILSRITGPTEGQIEIDGRVGSLLEVGTGFHHELSGRENIYLSGAILGMRRSEMDRRFDEIVDFAGVAKHIDEPVKHYSSGMYMRLAFAVAAHLETEVLLVDEVLAVGDAAFQLKCLNKMSEVSDSGRTILFVSHNMETVTKLCSRGLLLDQGRVASLGTPQECIEEYLSIAKERRAYEGTSISLEKHPGRTKAHNGPIRLTSISILDQQGQPTFTVNGGESMSVVFSYDVVERKPHNATFAVTFSNFYNHRLATCRSHDTHVEPLRVERSGSVVCRIPRLPFVPGFYRLSIGCGTESGHSDGVYDAVMIEVVGSSFFPSGLVPHRTHGEIMFDHKWEPKSEVHEPALKTLS